MFSKNTALIVLQSLEQLAPLALSGHPLLAELVNKHVMFDCLALAGGCTEKPPGHNVPNKYTSQSTWESEEAFRSWTQSQQFTKSHGEGQGNKRPNVGAMLDGPPAPEFYSAVTVTE
jgi:hypothetical protein